MEAFSPSPSLPEAVDVAIIGGGIIGITAALELAERGMSVAVCEKGDVGHEQSGRNWGWVRVMNRDPGEIPMALESQRLWEAMDKRIGADVGFRRSGIIYLADDEAAMAKHAEWLGHAAPYQPGTRLLGRAELASLVPGMKRAFVGGMFTPLDARAEPFRAVPAIAKRVVELGGHVLTGCAVRGLDIQGGRVAGVVTEKGRIRCQRAVLAGGAWSRLFLGNLGIDLPQLKVRGSVMRTKPMSGTPEFAVGVSDFAFRKRADGGYSIAHRGASVAEIVPDSFRLFGDFVPAFIRQRHELRVRARRPFLDEWNTPRRWSLDEKTPFEAVRVLDPAPDQDILDEAKRNLAAAFPAFAGVEIAASWAGFMDATPDAVPVIGEVPRLPGFIIATGFSGHGFGIGPGAGRAVAALAMGASPGLDMRTFRLDRFARLRRTTH